VVGLIFIGLFFSIPMILLDCGLILALRWLAKVVGVELESDLLLILLTGLGPIFLAANFAWEVLTWEMRSGPTNQGVIAAIGLILGLLLIVWPATYLIMRRTRESVQ